MEPIGISHPRVADAQQRIVPVIRQPRFEIEEVILFAPQKPGKSLAVDAALLFRGGCRSKGLVKLVRFVQAQGKHSVVITGKRRSDVISDAGPSQAQPNYLFVV